MNAPFLPPHPLRRADGVATLVERVFVLGHRKAGHGQGSALLPQLLNTLRAGLPRHIEVEGHFADDHDEVRAVAEHLVARRAPICIVAAGGGGTLRAVLEGSLAAGADANAPFCLGALRMGSGNVVGKDLAISADPLCGAAQIARSLRTARLVEGYVIRARARQQDGTMIEHYAAGLAGVGELASLPLEVERLRQTSLHGALSKVLPLERINDGEYALGMVKRALRVAVSPRTCPEVELHSPRGDSCRFRLLAGACMALPVKNLPVTGAPDLSDARVSLRLLSLQHRRDAVSLGLSPAAACERLFGFDLYREGEATLRLLDRERAPFFLDEDVLTFHGELRLSCAGPVRFVKAH